MTLPRMMRPGMAAVILLMGLLTLTGACGSGPDSDDAIDTGAAREPEISVDELMASAGEKLAAVSTVKFDLTDEKESGGKFFGMTLKSLEAEVKSPDGFRMFVNVENPSFGFVVIEMTALGEDSFIKFSADAPWLPLPPEEVPFNFAEMGPVLSRALPEVENTEITGRESVGGVESIRVQGDAVSEALADLITSVDPGHPISLLFWFNEADHNLVRLQILGKIFDDDAPETSRVITISEINHPVEITLPETAPQP